MTEEKKHWESFKDAVSVSKAIWADEDKKIDECLDMIIPPLRSKLKEGSRIFDLGCGNGRLLRPLSEKYPYTYFTGIDFSAPMIEFAIRNSNIIYILNDGETMPSSDNYFDGGYSMIMFQHITNENFVAYLKEIARALKPDGVFVFQFVEGVQQHFLSHNATAGEVRKWVSDAGMKVVSLTGGIYEVWKWVTVKK